MAKTPSNLMKILLFEAITGGGLGSPDDQENKDLIPSGTLFQEGLEMVASVAVDLAQAFQQPNSRHNNKSNALVHQILQALFHQLPDNHTNTLTIAQPTDSLQLELFWDQRITDGNLQLRSDTPEIPEPFLAAVDRAISSCWKKTEQSHTATSFQSIQKWSLNDSKLLKTIPTSCASEFWQINSDDPQTKRLKTIAPWPFQSDIRFVPISDAIQLKSQLIKRAQAADLVILIAPEPSLSTYVKWLEQSTNPAIQMLNLPSKSLTIAEDKRNYTTLPWLSLDKFFAATSPSSIVVQQGQFDHRQLLTGDLVLKPIRSCGSENTFRIRCADIEPKQNLIRRQQLLQQAWDRHIKPLNQAATAEDFFVMPWSSGTAASISFFAVGSDLYQFPVCEHLVSEEIIQEDTEGSIRQIRYTGSRWWASEQKPLAKEESAIQLLQELVGQPAVERLQGWFGIDLMIEDDTYQVLDFNGRWTSSYNLIRQLQQS